MKKSKLLLVVGLLIATGIVHSRSAIAEEGKSSDAGTNAVNATPAAPQGPVKSFNLEVVEKKGKKYWVMPTDKAHVSPKLTVKRGTLVKLHLVSNLGPHGFTLPAFKKEVVVDSKGVDVEFVADTEGEFPFHCQLHPAHVGGEIVVTQ